MNALKLDCSVAEDASTAARPTRGSRFEASSVSERADVFVSRFNV